jgi:ABC-type sulfate/molybdate transport systems ATPase subunit
MTLRWHRGIENPDAGRIRPQRADFNSTRKRRSIFLRSFEKPDFWFQDLALFPNMTVLENIRLAAPRSAKIPAEKYIETSVSKAWGTVTRTSSRAVRNSAARSRECSRPSRKS